MATEKELNRILNGDGAIKILWMIGLGICAIIFFISERNSSKTIKYYKAAKIIEIVIGALYAGWMLIYHIVAATSYPKYYHFVHFIDICATGVYFTGALFSLLGVALKKRILLFGQVLLCVYVIVEYLVMTAVFIGEYSTVFVRVADILMWIGVTIATVFGTFVTIDIYKRLKNEANIKKVQSNEREVVTDDSIVPPIREEDITVSEEDDHSQGTSLF